MIRGFLAMSGLYLISLLTLHNRARRSARTCDTGVPVVDSAQLTPHCLNCLHCCYCTAAQLLALLLVAAARFPLVSPSW